MGSKKQVKCEETVRGALETGASEIEQLKEEMDEWCGNLESAGMDHLPKYDEVSECCDALESAELDSPTVEQFIELLNSAVEGVPAKPGCPEHTVGTECPVCKWNGAADHAIPRRHEPVPEVLPIPGLDNLLETTVSYVETRPYGRRGPSRADRCGNACAALEAAVSALEEAFENLDSDDERVEELRGELEELRGKLEEIEGGVEFPGMF